MIVKLLVNARPFAAGGGGGWEYIDGVTRVTTHEATNPDGSSKAFTAAQLKQHVDEAFGPSELRSFRDEVWPQDMTDEFSRFATLAVLHHADPNSATLVIATQDCYLLGDTGQTVDRIY